MKHSRCGRKRLIEFGRQSKLGWTGGPDACLDSKPEGQHVKICPEANYTR
jgi:hypothetical protein